MPGLGGLVSRAGGRERVLLVGEWKPPSAREWLEALARDLFGEEEEEGQKEKKEKEESPSPPPCPPGPPPWPSCRLLFVLFGAASLLPSPTKRKEKEKERFRLRAILLDLRRRLQGGFPAVVGVAVLTSQGGEGDPAGSARLPLLALLRSVFRERKGANAEETLQAALYNPGAGGATQVEQAASKALSAALRIQADGVEIGTQKLPFFLQCLPWGRRRHQRKGQLETVANKVNEGNVGAQPVIVFQDEGALDVGSHVNEFQDGNGLVSDLDAENDQEIPDQSVASHENVPDGCGDDGVLSELLPESSHDREQENSLAPGLAAEMNEQIDNEQIDVRRLVKTGEPNSGFGGLPGFERKR